MRIFFSYPWFLYLLLIIPVLIILHFFSGARDKRRAIPFSNFEALERVSGIEFFSKSFFSLFLEILIIVLIVFSLSAMNLSYIAKTDSFDHVIVLDGSKSMVVSDIGASRISVAKISASNFIDSLAMGVNTGAILMGGEPEILKRPDSSKTLTKVAILDSSFSRIEGTNLFNSLIVANSLFEGDKKSILLVSDGDFSSEEFLDSLDYLVRSNIVVNTILVGSEEGGRDEFGTLHKTNSEFMKSLAFNSGGKYFEVRDKNVKIDFKEALSLTEKEVTVLLTPYLLIGLLAVFILLWLIINLRIRFIPR